MQKIPTLFLRDWNGDRSRVLPMVHPECTWVMDGAGIATKKIDGTCCMLLRCQLFRRHEVKKGGARPADFTPVEEDGETGKLIGWLPVGDGPHDKWHRAGLNNLHPSHRLDGTYELVGPHVQGNPEGYACETLVPHTAAALPLPQEQPRAFEGLYQYFARLNIEGIVWHNEDGRMAKIKKRDFGLKR